MGGGWGMIIGGIEIAFGFIALDEGGRGEAAGEGTTECVRD